MRLGRTLPVLRTLALTIALLLLWTPVRAAQLVIGLGSEVTTLDPHFHNLSPNGIVSSHIFDALTLPDEYKRPTPGLAIHWTAVDDRNWEFVLRRNVLFHDGTPFTAADAAASLRRALHVQDSPYSYATILRAVSDVVVVDDHTLRIRTATPDPTIPAAVGQVAVIPARFAEARREDFDAGQTMIGTGPFRFVASRGVAEITLAANTAYWGGRPPWDDVTLRVIPSATERVAALMGGSVHLIDQVPPSDFVRLHGDREITVRSGLTARLIYLALDSGRDRSPFVTDRKGKPLARNPLKDPRVRRAISKAINRQGTVDMMLEGLGSPAGQLLPVGFFGASPLLTPDTYDPEGAKRLLAEAGWPDGFALTLHAPNNRYTNDAAVARTLGVALSRIGIATKVETMPATDFFARASKLEFSAFMSGITTDIGETTDILTSLLASYDADRNRGRINRARYSNPTIDSLLDRSSVTLDPKARESLLRQASEMAMADAAVLPLYFESKVWAMRKEFSYTPRADEYTLAVEVEPTRPSAAH
ncbi:ABC transporter substrate-binding protein [Azospirillum sp. sgz302134]